MPVKTLIIFVLYLCLLGTGLASNGCPLGVVRHSFPELEAGEDRLVYFALQEAGFARKRLGEWLAKALIAAKRDVQMEWYVWGVERKDNQIKLTFGVCVNRESHREWTTSFFNKGPDEVISPVVRVLEDRVVIEIAQDADGVMRHLLVMQSNDVSELRDGVGASKLRPTWTWEPIRVDSR